MDKEKYSYRFSEMANEDLISIFDYIAYELSSPQSADKLIDKIEKQVVKLCEFPLSFPFVQDDFLREKGYRRLVIQNFNLFYIIEDNLIIIERVLYGRRAYENLL